MAHRSRRLRGIHPNQLKKQQAAAAQEEQPFDSDFDPGWILVALAGLLGLIIYVLLTVVVMR